VSQVSRRSVVVLGAAVLAGCGDRSGSSGTSARPSPPTSTRPAHPPSARADPLPVTQPWRPDPNDLDPLCKLTAVRRVERAGNRRGHALQVVDAQYGGLLAGNASVLVVTRSWVRRDARVVSGGHTYDVRLSRTAGGWRVAAVHPSHPGPRARTLTPAARRVLASDRIALPPAGRADVLSGRVHDSVLRAMLAVGASYRIDISVVRSGHPVYVFGTDRLSDHPQGRAFDTWAIEGKPVVDARTPRGLVEDYMHAAAAAGSYNVGGPYLLGAAPQWFTDATHHDHVHAGFLT
jgi:hypothetical protein